MNPTPFLPEAEREFLEAVATYEAERDGLGGEFLTEVERATRRIRSFPTHGSPYLAGTRRIVLRRFPYSVVYTSEADDLFVVAVAHHRRKPAYWRTRLSDTRVPTQGFGDDLNAAALLRFARRLEGERLATRARGAVFTLRVLDSGLEVTPESTGRPRVIAPAVIEQVCFEFLQIRSTKPGDYQSITFDASYLLVLIERYLRR